MNITLCVTHNCNLRCSYCYAGRKFNREMDWQTAKTAIDFGIKEAINNKDDSFQIGFFGGEPLLEWDLIVKSTDYCSNALRKTYKKKKLPVPKLKKTLTTNVTLLNKQRSDWLKENNFFIGLSIDGNKAMHDVFRKFSNGKSSHARCMEGLKHFLNPEDGEVIIVVSPENIHHLVDSVKWLIDEAGVSNISLNPDFYSDKIDDSYLEKWRKAYQEVSKLYLKSFREGQYLAINFIDSKIRTHLKEGYADCDKCSFGEKEISVAPSGNIYPCERVVANDDDKEMCIGNVFEGFDNVKRLKILQNRGNRNKKCQNCPLKCRCMNWCACINYATTGKTDIVHKYVCFHEKMTIEIADQVASKLFAEENPLFLKKFYEQ